jgi:signal transduction histidine kinase/ligand-binding sensor domain-containing protein/DNA-binding response OmpR family regulator
MFIELSKGYGRLYQMAILSYIIILLLFTAGLFSHQLDLQFEHIATEDGLSSNSVWSIVEDKQGFMWFGTSKGLNRYDGYTFKVFTHDPNDSNSISDDYIMSLFADKSGYLWIGTSNGLNRYDPQTERFSRYLRDEEDSLSISNNCINTIFKDSKGNLWFGSEKGLNLYNRQSDTFTHFFFPGQLDSASFWWNNNTIRAINENKNGTLLLGTSNDFLIFDPKTKEITTIPYVIPAKKRWPQVFSICKDRLSHFWIAVAGDGVIEYNPENGKTRLYQKKIDDPFSYSGLASRCIYEDSKGLIWIGSLDHGLNIFDRATGKFIHSKQGGRGSGNLRGYIILSIYEDRQGNIWIGTYDYGINVSLKWKKPFKHYVHDPQNPEGLYRGEVTGFYEDKDNLLWMTHLHNCISIFDRNAEKFTHLIGDPKNLDGMSPGGLYGIYEDKSGYLWLAITPDINRLNPKTGEFKHYRYSLSNPKSHAYTYTLCCCEDGQGTMWFGTANAGLERLNNADETINRFCYDAADSTSISNNCIISLYLDKAGDFWIGTGNGLCQLVYDSGGKEKFIRYQTDPDNPASIEGRQVLAFCEDRSGRFWIGTGGGLNLFNREQRSFKAFTVKYGLPDNAVLGIIEDDQGQADNQAGNLWLRTLRGIVKFNPETYQMRVYDEGDGLKNCNSIQEGLKAFYKTRNGEIYSGSTNSVAAFFPDSLKDNPDIPPIVLTDLKINYESVKNGTNSPLQRSLNATEVIKLAYFQNTLSFEFAALDYTSPKKNLYAYKLEGINSDWIYTNALRRFATYTNLDPGEYVFHVKGSNNDGIWNEEGTSLKIIITPPWWKTNWAYSFYLLLMVLAIYGAWRFQMNRIRMRHNLEMKQLHAEKLEEVDRMKSRFFANISHEFRTPLTLILGPISQMFSQTRSSNFRENLSMMKRNALRLQRLINQLLDLSKLEAGRMKLRVREENIVALLKCIVQAFESLAKLKNIQLVFQSDMQSIMGYIDREKLETIVNNLLSNAFKFTPEGGKVVVEISLTPLSIPPLDKGGKAGGVGIHITDTGTGIPPDRLPHIFDRFYQVDDSYSREPALLDSSSSKKYQLGEKYYPTGQEGTGIGLALTKELVEFHKGEISVSSQLGKGTTFVIRLPIGKEAYSKDEMAETAAPLVPSLIDEEEKGSFETVDTEIQTITKSKKDTRKSLPILLVVEDNPDMRVYIRSNLESAYRIIEAVDGQEGFTKCAKVLPDLVISDVMMPKMGGFVLCAKLKTDHRTSHIPVILLTARAAGEDKIGGLETGADDYIIKPFDARELQVRVKNLIEQRRKLRERFRKEGILQPQEVAVTPTDQKFLQKVLEIVESHISDERFSVETFGKEIGMSRTLLYRKLQALTDYSPNEFIRSLRLNHAAQLLAKHGGNVTEIAFQVGFNNLSYFARCFQRQFGVSPSRYASKKPYS